MVAKEADHMPSATVRRRDHIFEEFDVVRTRAALSVEGHVLPSGSHGAIVLVHRDGVAFEVEFVEPLAIVVTLEAGDIEPA